MESSIAVSLDWLAFTLHVSSFDAVPLVEQVVGTIIPSGKSWLGYPESCACATGAMVGWDPLDYNGVRGIHVSLPGSFLGAIPYKQYIGLLAYIFSNHGTISRLDVAFDDFSGLVSMRRVEACLRKGAFVSRVKLARSGKRSSIRFASSLYHGGKLGRTAYIGSSASNTLVRIYDKALEQGVGSSWIRVELQLRSDRAHALAYDWFVRENVDWSLAQGVVLSFLRFVSLGGDRNKARRGTLAWWSRLFLAKCYRLLRPLVRGRSIEGIYTWLLGQCSRSLALISLVPGMLENVISAGEKRLTHADLALVGIGV